MNLDLSKASGPDWDFNRSGATRAVALNISEAFERLWHAGLLRKLKSYGI